MCAHDWGMKQVLGNFNDQSFLDIWFGEEFRNVRSKLLTGTETYHLVTFVMSKEPEWVKNTLCNG